MVSLSRLLNQSDTIFPLPFSAFLDHGLLPCLRPTVDLLFCLWLFSFDRVLARREFKSFVLGLCLKWEVLSTAFCPLDSGRGCPEFWPSIYYLENGNDCIIRPACLPRTGKGWRDVGIISEQKQQHTFKLLLVHGRQPSKRSPQPSPKVARKAPASWLLGSPSLFRPCFSAACTWPGLQCWGPSS